MFQNEVMECDQCKRKYKSPHTYESQWIKTTIPAFRHHFYYCPECFGNDPDWWQRHDEYKSKNKTEES